jgi:hypothetical protein
MNKSTSITRCGAQHDRLDATSPASFNRDRAANRAATRKKAITHAVLSASPSAAGASAGAAGFESVEFGAGGNSLGDYPIALAPCTSAQSTDAVNRAHSNAAVNGAASSATVNWATPFLSVASGRETESAVTSAM